MSFLQYAAKEYSSPLLYMGRDLYKESLFASNQNIWNLVNRKYVVGLFLLIVLPIEAKVAIIGIESQLLHNILLLVWIGVNIIIIGTFTMVFIKCARELLKLMVNEEEQLLKDEACSYNEKL